MVALLLVLLVLVSVARANVPPASRLLPAPRQLPAPSLLDIHAQTDIVAALECEVKGYRYMLRLGRDDVLCLHTNVAAVKRAVDVRKFLKKVRPDSPN